MEKAEKIKEIKRKLLELHFNVNSEGFNFWASAIYIRIRFADERIKMEDIYKELAFEYITTEKAVERNMRTASKTAIEKIQEYFNYKNKITNKTILELFRKE